MRAAPSTRAGRALPRLLCPLLLLGCLGGGAMATAAPPPVSAFFDHAQMSEPLLSPQGGSLAVRMARPGERDVLAVLDLATLALREVAHFSDFDLGQFAWVNEERLVYNVRDNALAPADRRLGAGLFAVDRDGSHFRMLAETSYAPPPDPGTIMRRNLQPWNTYLLAQDGAQDTDRIYVRRAIFDETGSNFAHWDLLQLDTRTGSATKVGRPGPVQAWLLDQHGEPRLARTEAAGLVTMHYLDPATSRWRQLAQFAAYGPAPGAFEPLGFGPDGQLYVSAQAGGDKRAAYRYDVAAGKLAVAPLVALPAYDFDGSLVHGRDKLLGMRVLSDGRAMVWFDPAMRAIQQRIDTLLPATNNLISVAAHGNAPWLLVEAYSDRQPPYYLLYNSASGELKVLGHSHPGIVPAQMARRELVHYRARDGLDIPAWLTLPAGDAQHRPMVVLVHGGPYVRGGEWGWDEEAQFLASRGYAVLQPEFRGSTGYGSRHFRAGWKQWGLAMQDDLADGTRWAIAQGIADPGRVCIAGASYGGYAALMGLVNDGALYRCAIDWLGVTDIGRMYTDRHSVLSDIGPEWRSYGLPQLVGDPVHDAAQFQATSPLVQAARIKQPLLLAYGSDDRRVPRYQGQEFYDAVRKTNQQVEWVLYDGEGHGWTLAKNRIDFWGRVERFLERNIGQH